MQEQSIFEEELQFAESAFIARDFNHAAHHLSGALVHDPMNPQALELFDSIIQQSTSPSELIPLTDDAYFGDVMARAYIEAKKNNYNDAIKLLTQVLQDYSELELESWLKSWLADARFKQIEVDIEPVKSLLDTLLGFTKHRARLRKSESDLYRRFIPLVGILEKFYSDNQEVMVMCVEILRRAEQHDDALALCARLLKSKRSAQVAVAQGMTYRSMDQFSRAISSFELAFKLDNKDPKYLIEMARARWDAGGKRAGAKLLKKALKRNQEYEKDQEFNVMQRYLLGDEELNKIIGTEARADDVKYLMLPMVGYLLSANDLSIQTMESISRDKLFGQSLHFSVDCIEPPSVLLAISLATTGRYDIERIDYSFDSVPDKDPRRPASNSALTAWSYDDTGRIPVQVPNKPSPQTLSLVMRLADQPYFLPRWWCQAKQIMKNNAIDPSELVGVMVYPPQAPESYKLSTWIRQSQIAAALMIAAIESNWADSAKRETLFSLVDGPIDWVTDAAVIALTEVALDDPAALHEVALMFEHLYNRVPEFGHWSICATLPLCYRRLPGRPKYMRDQFGSLLSQYKQTSQ